jgi:hypothetical protein
MPTGQPNSAMAMSWPTILRSAASSVFSYSRTGSLPAAVE